ncbi:MAG: hypothetical protein JJE37_04320 [Methyloceanibacter sp.]|jgi:hypothetical protein|nr:hypothetical protein [Methyloceanibacter sp.]
MSTVNLIFAFVGALIPPVVIVQALRSKARDRWPEGLLTGVYLGVLGSISLIAILTHYGLVIL